jgi:hypothetical protein
MEGYKTSYLILSETTGALVDVRISTEPFDTSHIDAAGKAVVDTIEANRKKEKEKLQLKKDILKLKSDISELSTSQ